MSSVDQRGRDVEQRRSDARSRAASAATWTPSMPRSRARAKATSTSSSSSRGPQAGLRLVDGDDAEQRPVGTPHRDDRASSGCQASGSELIERSGTCDGQVLPVGLVVRDQVGAAPEEALGEERRPGSLRACRAEQRLARALVAVHRRHLEVAFGGPVEVDRDSSAAERIRDRRRNPVDRRVRSRSSRTSRVTSSRPRSCGREESGSECTDMAAGVIGACTDGIEPSLADGSEADDVVRPHRHARRARGRSRRAARRRPRRSRRRSAARPRPSGRRARRAPGPR